MLVSRNWLQKYFDKELPPGEELAEVLMNHAFEIEGAKAKGDDFIIDVDVLPNRAHDCLSHRGTAREVSGLLNLPMKETLEEYSQTDFQSSQLKPEINIENGEKCRRYIGRIIENIEIKDSEDWMKKLLESIDQRSKNNVVDATNFTLFDLGQPTHVFDFDKVEGAITIRNAKDGEKITLLTGEEIELDNEMLIIADDEKPLALAGIKGGNAAEVDKNTKNILIEVANFDPITVRKTRQKIGMMTDASKRFENELTPELAGEAVDLLTNLIVSVGGDKETKVGTITDNYPAGKPDVISVNFSLEQTNNLLGTEISTEDVSEILERFRYEFKQDDDRFAVQIPPERYDLRIPEDMIEEIGRIYGYDKIEGKTVESLEYKPEINKLFFYQNKVRNLLIQNGYSEVETYMFREKGDVRVANPVAKDKPFLRTNLVDGMGDALELNEKNTGLFAMDVIRLFEFGKVVIGDKEINKLSIGVRNINKQAKKEYGDGATQISDMVKRIQDALESTPLNSIGDDLQEIDLDKFISKLPEPEDYDDIFDIHSYDREDLFQPFSQYPFVSRDIAVWVPGNVDEQAVQEIIVKNAGENLFRVDLFDKFEKNGKTSFAFRMIFQSLDKTLSDEEVNSFMDDINTAITDKGWEIR